VNADNATGLVVGTGQFLYDVFRPWGVLPAGWTFGLISHVAVDSKDRVYFYQRKDPPILVFDSDGNFLTGWGAGRLRDAHGIYVGSDDHIYVCNRDEHEVLKLTADGTIVLALGQRGRPSLQAPFNHPADVAVAPNGEIYVADGYGNAAIHRFSPEGTHLCSWGAPGAGRGQFSTPHGIWVDVRDRVLVADRENNRVQLFSPEGDFYGEWADLYHPMVHDPIPAVGTWLRQVVGGHIRYYGVPMNSPAIALFRFQVGWLWHRALARRSQTGHVAWERMRRLIERWLPPARICHPYPLRRLGVVT
jgi:hypothetical protein